MLRECTTCKTVKNEIEFNWRSKKDNKRSYQCKECYSAVKKRYYADNADKVKSENGQRKKDNVAKFKAYKEKHKCACCPETESVCLDFHHLDGSTKEALVSDMAHKGRSWENILKEIDKCIVVCRNCHAKIHAGIITL